MVSGPPRRARSKSVTAGLRVARRCESVGTHADLRQRHPSRPALPVARAARWPPTLGENPTIVTRSGTAKLCAVKPLVSLFFLPVKPPRGALFSAPLKLYVVLSFRGSSQKCELPSRDTPVGVSRRQPQSEAIWASFWPPIIVRKFA